MHAVLAEDIQQLQQVGVQFSIRGVHRRLFVEVSKLADICYQVYMNIFWNFKLVSNSLIVYEKINTIYIYSPL